MPFSEGVTVCIPAYNSGALIVDTLTSLQAQTFQNFKVVISIDGGDAITLDQCRPFLKDQRFRIFLQPKRLGWVQNTNWLLSRAEGRFVSILPHDDLLHPFYLEELLNHMLRHPDCALAYCDTEGFSDDPDFRPFSFIQPSLRGSQHQRMKNYLTKNFECPGFRSLIAKSSLDATGLLVNNPFDDFAADTLWLGKFAKVGELHRLPFFLCRKRYHSANTHQKWSQKPKEHQRSAWKRHCLDLLDAFTQELDEAKKKQELIDAAKERYIRGCFRFRIFS